MLFRSDEMEMSMRTLNTCLLLLAVLFSFSADLSAQARYPNPERMERTTKADDQGLQQWTEWKAEKCKSCKGVGKSTCQTCDRFGKDAKDCPECKRVEKLLAPCRVCAGSGTLADPLKQAPCAGCMGAGFLLCTVCGGGGRLKVGGAKRWSDCPACRKKGGFDCGGCKGKRVMTALQIKPTMADAPVDKLKKAKKDLDAMIKKLAKFKPGGGTKARKEVKALEAAFNTGKKIHPSFKLLAKSTKSYMSKIFSGAQFQDRKSVV